MSTAATKAHFKARTLGVCYLLPHVRWYKVRRTHDSLSKPGLCSDCGERIVVRVLPSGGVRIEACSCWRPLPRATFESSPQGTENTGAPTTSR